MGILESQTTLDPAKSLFDRPTMAVMSDDVLGGKAEVSCYENILLGVAWPSLNQYKAKNAPLSDLVPESIKHLDP